MKKKLTNKPFVQLLFKLAGFSAIGAGLLFAGIQLIHPKDVIESVGTDIWVPVTVLKTLFSVFGLFAITGLYAKQVEETKLLGLLGYCLLILFFAVQMCYSFAQAFILPLIYETSPDFASSMLGLASGDGGNMDLGMFALMYHVLSAFYLLGTLLFGISLFRVSIMPRFASGLMAFSGPLAIIMVAVLPHSLDRFAAFPMSLSLILLGYALIVAET